MLVTDTPSLPRTGGSAALDDTRREAPHLAGVLCVDIHGFASQTAVEQARSRSVLINVLSDALADMAPSSWWQIDVQHGILIVCPVSPDDVMYLAQCLLLHPELYRWRLGLHIGLLHTAPDLEGRAQTVGDGVARARLMASHALPAQALASRAYVEAVSDSRPGYGALFIPTEDSDPTLALPQHALARTSERWMVAPSADWLITLRNEVIRRSMRVQGRRLAAAQAAAASPGGSTPQAASAAGTAASAQTPADATPWTQVRELIARWFVPINALLVSIGLLLSQGHRFGLNEQRLLAVGLTLMALAGVWLVLSRLSSQPAIRGHAAAAWVGLAYGALLSLGATAALVFALPQPAGPGFSTQVTPLEPASPVSPPAALPRPAPVAPQAAGTEPSAADNKTLATTPRPEPAQARPAAAPATAASARLPPSPGPLPTPVATTPAPVRSAAVAPAAPVSAPMPTTHKTSPANTSRCNAIVARSALGEPLSPEDRQELLTSCR